MNNMNLKIKEDMNMERASDFLELVLRGYPSVR